MRPSHVHGAFLAVLFAFPAAGRAQQLQSTGPDTTCRCRIVLERVAQLGRMEDTIAILGSGNVARDSRGRFYVAGILPYAGIAQYGPDGRHLATLGRAGAGPGELQRVRYVRILPGDSLFVHDDRRLTVFDPAGSYVRAVALPVGPLAFRFTTLGDGSVVLNNYFPTHHGFVLLDRDYIMSREFGRSIPHDLLLGDSDALQARMVDIGGGRFAALQQNYRYEFTVWDTSGALVHQSDREPRWFTRYTREQRQALGFASRYPWIADAWGDLPQRRLWTVARVPDPHWKEPACRLPAGSPQYREGSGCVPIPSSKQQRAFDTVIEVLDMDTGRPLISQRFDAVVDAFTEGGLLYALRENEDGLMVIDVWRPEILATEPR